MANPPPVSCAAEEGAGGGAVFSAGLPDARRFLGFAGGGRGGGRVFSVVFGAMGGGGWAETTSGSSLEEPEVGVDGFCRF